MAENTLTTWTDQELAEKIVILKEKKNAVLLAHYYQVSEIQDIADYVGDSLGLAQKASQTNAEIIVFAWNTPGKEMHRDSHRNEQKDHLHHKYCRISAEFGNDSSCNRSGKSADPKGAAHEG